MKMTDIAWAAGFIEGDGSPGGSTSYTIHLDASQINREPLNRLRSLFGGDISLGKTLKGDKDFWYWKIYSDRAAEVMMTIYCLMSQKRKEQIRKCLKKWRATGPNNNKKTTCPRGHIYDKFYQAKNPDLRVQHYRYCRECHNEACRRWTQNHPEQRDEIMQRYYQKRRERIAQEHSIGGSA